MREIEFRGKFSDKTWVYGYYIRDTLIDYIDVGRGYKYQIDPKTVGQFTGLLDKNGKKIFEGDVVEVFEMCVDGDGVEFKSNLTRHMIEWGGKSYPAFDLIPPIADDMNSLSYLDSTSELEMEVVGNIYDNPELIKETNEKA